MPTIKTISKNIETYARRAGFLLHPQTDGDVALFDIRADYYVFRGSRQRASQFIVDELHMIAYNRQNQAKVGIL